MSDVNETKESDDDYIARVVAEIEQEVAVRRAKGDIPKRLERQLDELFLAHSPVASRRGGLGEAIAHVESSAYVDPVAPVASSRPGGAMVKKSIRKLIYWYMGTVVHQINQFASSVTRALQIIEDRIDTLEERTKANEPLGTLVVDAGPTTSKEQAWWFTVAREALSRKPGRVLHAAAMDGWCVRALLAQGIDAYGLEGRSEFVPKWEDGSLDIREEPLAEHLGAVSKTALAGVVLTGLLDGMGASEATTLLASLTERIVLGGTLVIYAWTRQAWEGPDGPKEADLCAGHPWKPDTYDYVLSDLGFAVSMTKGPLGNDFLVSAHLERRPPIL